MNIYDLAQVNESDVRELEYKLFESMNINEFTEDEHKLIYKLAGSDLLTSTMSRTLVLLYSKNQIGEWYGNANTITISI